MREAAATSIPDYGWESTEPERSHDYLQPIVVEVLQAIARGRATVSARPLRVFDAGCGNGALLHRMHGLGYAVAGCDASESGVRHATALCGDDVWVKQLSVYDNLSQTFGATWDVVVSTEVIEHLYAPRAFIAQAQRLLVPDGVLVLTTPYHGYLKNLALAATGALDRHFTALWDGGHIKFWSYRTLTALLSEFGFDDFSSRGAGRLPGLWKSMVVTASRRQSTGRNP